MLGDFMTLKNRLILVFAALILGLIGLSVYTNNITEYMKEKDAELSQITYMTESLKNVEFNQLKYVYTQGREEANQVFSSIRAMYDYFVTSSHNQFTSNQQQEIEKIKENLQAYESQFTLLISLNNQINAIVVGIQEELSTLGAYTISMSMSDDDLDKDGDIKNLKTKLLNFYIAFIKGQKYNDPTENIPDSAIKDLSDAAIAVKKNQSLPMDLQLQGFRIEMNLSKLTEDREKYRRLQEDVLLSNQKMQETADAIVGNVVLISAMQKQIIDLEQERVSFISKVIIGFLCLFFFCVTFYTIHYVTLQLKALLNATDLIAEGQYNTRMDAAKNDEFGYLARRVNKMAQSLENSATKQNEINNNLEVLVTERTKELNEAKNSLEKINNALSLEKERFALLARTDELTGLNNRRSTLEFLQNQIKYCIRYKHPLTIMEIDIDHFKKVNDQYGHIAGDEVLVKLSHIFTKTIREVDLVGRIGGEEFLFIFPEGDEAHIKVLIERIQTEVSKTRFAFAEISITFSGGVAQLDNETALELIQIADKKLYLAKDTGRNQVVY